MVIKGRVMIRNDMTHRLFTIGQFPLCNLKPNRAPHVGKHTFILCWRCTGVLVGFFLSQLFILSHFAHCHWLVSGALIMPCASDGLLQHLDILQSNNVRRFTTGFFAGIGISIL